MIYYLIYFFLAYQALQQKKINIKKITSGLILIGIFLIIFTGLRDNTGGDWGNYFREYYISLPYMNLYDVLNHTDPGFWLLSYTMYKLGFNIYGTNLVISLIFFTGLFQLLKHQTYMKLGLAIAFPYLIIVVCMGYTRQAAAIGFVMWALAALEDNKFLKFLIFISLAVTFHKSAIVMIGFGIFSGERGKFFKFLALVTIALGLYFSFVSEEQSQLVEAYIYEQMHSSGAYIRVFMNLIPAILLIYTRDKWRKIFHDYKFWFYIALSSFIAVFFVKDASTAVDRLSLYFIPLQLIVFSRLPILLEDKINKDILKILILLYYFLILFVWLNFGNFSYWWVPYQNIIFKNLL